jgi:hypothetical protein
MSVTNISFLLEKSISTSIGQKLDRHEKSTFQTEKYCAGQK